MKEADQIIMLYRDEVYNPETDSPGVMELSVEKNRHGATGLVRAAWDGRYLAVSDMHYIKPNELPAPEVTGGFKPVKAEFLPNQKY